MVSTLILDQCKRVGTIYFQIYFGIKKGNIRIQTKGKTDKEELETTKTSVRAGKYSR